MEGALPSMYFGFSLFHQKHPHSDTSGDCTVLLLLVRLSDSFVPKRSYLCMKWNPFTKELKNMGSLGLGTRLWDCITLWWMHFFFCKQALCGRRCIVEPALPITSVALRPTICEGLNWEVLLLTTLNTGNLLNVTYSAGIHWKTKLFLV